jgi:hypothetical protein
MSCFKTQHASSKPGGASQNNLAGGSLLLHRRTEVETRIILVSQRNRVIDGTSDFYQNPAQSYHSYA